MLTIMERKKGESARALSEDYKECTMQILLDKADSYMYDNKQLCKQHTL